MHLIDARLLADTSAFDLLTASAAERAAAKSLVAKLRSRGVTPRRYLRDEVIRCLGIVGTAEAPLLLDLLDFIVLQALSTGRVGLTCARLHVLVVGPPAAGKKLIGLAARALNPVAVELSPAKVSAAGLVGASSQKDGVWRSTPGALSRAHGGVATLQDANFWRSKQLHEVGAVLLEVIEDGVVRSAVAGATTPHQAHTALLIDMNRDRQAWGGGPRNEAPLLTLKPLLSRLDLIVEIERDDESAIAIAARIAATVARSPNTDSTWMRKLQLLVAVLREEHPSIDLEPVGECLSEAVRTLCLRAAEAHLDVGDFAARFAISLHRLTSALARSADRAIAEPRDVEEARHFIELKIDALESLGCESVPNAIDLDSWLDRFRGQEVSPADLREAYKRDTGHIVNERTVRRHIQDRAHARVGKGRYKLL